jgi:hypothetical protein
VDDGALFMLNGCLEICHLGPEEPPRGHQRGRGDHYAPEREQDDGGQDREAEEDHFSHRRREGPLPCRSQRAGANVIKLFTSVIYEFS